MREIKYIITLLVILFSLSTCERVEYFVDNPIQFDSTMVLCHRGGGYIDKGNTLSGCIFGFNHFDGIECDIQISTNKTLWLSHESILVSCENKGRNCFASTSDDEIVSLDSCLGNEKDFTRLEEVFEYMQLNFPNKYISLDVKAWKPCEFERINLTSQMNTLAERIIYLGKKYTNSKRILVESETGDFLYYIKTHSNDIETYLTTNGDFELGISRALHAGFTGISFKYNYLEDITEEKVKLLHRKGLKVQIWTINGKDQFGKALNLNPDFIQTDELIQ